MFNATEVLIGGFVSQLASAYQRDYGRSNQDYEDIVGWAGRTALEIIAGSDALYHDVQHTIYVTIVGQEILRGKHIREGGVSAQDWLHFALSLLCHDIGYVRNVCRGDANGRFATGNGDETIKLKNGATDAALTPYHVDRGKLFVEERFGGLDLIDAEVIKRNIELTRFPVPAANDYAATNHYPGLLRAADLIGQLSDPRYIQKISALFYEFEETGVNAELGYENPGDLRRGYPRFFRDVASTFMEQGIRYLEVTQAGQQIVASLYANLYALERVESDAN